MQFLYHMCHLKSNMDRFIERDSLNSTISRLNLKSNMDRFIGLLRQCSPSEPSYLKSNMDRFIGNTQYMLE